METICEYNHPKTSFLQSLFYYIATAILSGLLLAVVYWQMEADSAEIQLTKIEVNLDKDNRSFFVPLVLCNTKHNDFILLRRYKDVKQDVYFNAPDGVYRANFTGCATTYLQAYAGSLEPGVYEYTVEVRYNVNFLRTIEKQVASVKVVIK